MKNLYKAAIIYDNKKDLIENIFLPNDTVLDVGFCGQGINMKNEAWNHNLIKKQVSYVFGIDINNEIETLPKDNYNYEIKSAENFNYEHKFSKIYGGDIIEHLSNPGLFLDSCKTSLSKDGQLIITTPNTFNLFNIIEKIFRLEPTVNKEHCAYYNLRTLSVMLNRHGLKIESVAFINSLEIKYKQSISKRLQNVIYFTLSLFTNKFLETIVITARKNED